MDDDDRALIEEVAHSKDSDLLPHEYRGVGLRAGFLALVSRLVELGVMAEPVGTTLIADVVEEARAAAKRWLDDHPRSDASSAARVS